MEDKMTQEQGSEKKVTLNLKPTDFIIILVTLLIILFIIPFTRNLFLDKFRYHITDSFHTGTEYFFNRGVLYSEKGRDKLALDTFKRNLKTPNPSDPYYIESLFNAGVLHYSKGQSLIRKDRTKAFREFRDATDYFETFRQYYANVNEPSIALKLQNIAEAQTYIDSLDEEKVPPLARQMKNEGQKAFYMNDLANALKFYKRAVEVDPTYDTVYNNIGTVYFYLQQYTNTVQYWERAVLLDPEENNDLFLSLAGVYEQYVGNQEKAIYYYTEYLKRNPKDPQKKEIKKQVKNLKDQLKATRSTI